MSNIDWHSVLEDMVKRGSQHKHGYLALTHLPERCPACEIERLQEKMEELERQVVAAHNELWCRGMGETNEIERLREENLALTTAFKHTHVAKYDEGILLDECGKCGLDLRNPVHRRSEP